MQEVMEKYELQKVVLQGLQDKASKFAAMVAAFCERLGWGDLEMLITKFQGSATSCHVLSRTCAAGVIVCVAMTSHVPLPMFRRKVATKPYSQCPTYDI
jgi:hypothetical protein